MSHTSHRILTLRILILAACLLLIGCGEYQRNADTEKVDPGTPESSRADVPGGTPVGGVTSEELHPYFHIEEQPIHAEWSYTGATGPSHWGNLSASYVLADEGKRQSPIDIEQAEKADLTPLEFDYQLSKIHIVYDGHAIQQNEDAGSRLKVGDRSYQLRQFHFHSPSEHTIEGRHFALEMHLVHKDDDGRIAVVALLFEEGAENDWLGPVWKFLPTKENRQREINVEFNIGGILPTDLSYYEYSGSLTTPPCTEGVDWFVMQVPQSISSSQLAAFTSVIENNNRPTQPLNGRSVEASK